MIPGGREPNFPMVIEVRAEPHEELLVSTAEGDLVETVSSVPGSVGIRMNAKRLLQLARAKDPSLLEDVANLVECAYRNITANLDRPGP